MNETQTFFGIVDELTAERIERWFNRWLAEPISDRERVIIAETIYALQHPNDVSPPQPSPDPS